MTGVRQTHARYNGGDDSSEPVREHHRGFSGVRTVVLDAPSGLVGAAARSRADSVVRQMPESSRDFFVAATAPSYEPTEAAVEGLGALIDLDLITIVSRKPRLTPMGEHARAIIIRETGKSKPATPRPGRVRQDHLAMSERQVKEYAKRTVRQIAELLRDDRQLYLATARQAGDLLLKIYDTGAFAREGESYRRLVGERDEAAELLDMKLVKEVDEGGVRLTSKGAQVAARLDATRERAKRDKVLDRFKQLKKSVRKTKLSEQRVYKVLMSVWNAMGEQKAASVRPKTGIRTLRAMDTANLVDLVGYGDNPKVVITPEGKAFIEGYGIKSGARRRASASTRSSSSKRQKASKASVRSGLRKGKSGRASTRSKLRVT